MVAMNNDSSLVGLFYVPSLLLGCLWHYWLLEPNLVLDRFCGVSLNFILYNIIYITDIISVIRFKRSAFLVGKRLSRRSELCSDLFLSRGLVRFRLVNFFSTNPNRHPNFKANLNTCQTS